VTNSTLLNKETNATMANISPISSIGKRSLLKNRELPPEINRTKKCFLIKTSVSQTRFSMKDIKDLMEQFNKQSNWVLVDTKGKNIN
jgi:RNA-binding protein YhbY